MKQLPKNKWEKCPNEECNDSGGYPHQICERQYVTRDMALDAGEPLWEGMLYNDEEWELVQCEFCWTNPKSVFYQKNKLWKKK